MVASISQSQSQLALGNILGSSISNILGAFSLGLIFSPTAITFDKSAKIYTGVLLGLTTFFTTFILFFESLGRFGGVLLIGTFIIYIASIAWAIYNGVVAPPEDSDSDSDSDSSDSDSDSDEESSIPLKRKSPSQLSLPARPGSASSNATTLRDHESASPTQEATPLAPEIFEDAEAQIQPQSNPLAKELFDNISLSASTPLKTMTSKSRPHSTLYHLAQLILGFLALSLSGYILSHSISSLSTQFSLSSTVLGITFLSLATTLPEKLVSIMSSQRGEHGIVIANTAGSNIFLVTLCAGVLFCAGDLKQLKSSVTLFEVLSMWVSSVVLFGIVMVGGKKWMGWCLFAVYIAFICAEFTIDRR